MVSSNKEGGLMDCATMEKQSLDYIGIIEGTDKTSLAVDYLRHYERILRGIRNEAIQLLEIGIAEGASLRTWEKFLPHAAIIGVDIAEVCRSFAGGRVIVEVGSQADPKFLSMLAIKYHPSVIVDDGSHQSADIFLTFEQLFPSLRPGGIYIIEDVHGGISPTEHFATAARRLASRHSEPACDENIHRLEKMIDRIEFIANAIIIFKRDGDDERQRLDYLFDAAQRADRHLTWFHLSMVLLNHKDLKRAEFAAQRAVALAPNRSAYWPRLSYVQASLGKLVEAIESLQNGIKIEPSNASLRNMLTSLEARASSE
jgi:hypothetical protein